MHAHTKYLKEKQKYQIKFLSNIHLEEKQKDHVTVFCRKTKLLCYTNDKRVVLWL